MAEADPISFHRSFEGMKVAEISERAHRLRSGLLDAFAKLENELYEVSASLGVKHETSAPLAQRMAAIRSATCTEAKRKAWLDRLLDELARFCTFRGHIVHSTLSPVLNLSDHSVLIMFRTVPIAKGMGLTIPLDDLNKLPGQVANLANGFKQFRQAPAPVPPAATSATA